jgi:hypothetical protein
LPIFPSFSFALSPSLLVVDGPDVFARTLCARPAA